MPLSAEAIETAEQQARERDVAWYWGALLETAEN
jgi:hypothetical protein